MESKIGLETWSAYSSARSTFLITQISFMISRHNDLAFEEENEKTEALQLCCDIGEPREPQDNHDDESES